MSCGCAPLSHAERTRQREVMAACALCPSREGWTECGIDRLPLVDCGVPRRACPLGRIPGARGRCVWWGIEWLGIPAPARWWLRSGLSGLPRLSGPLPGCGCVRVLKAAWRRLRGPAARRPAQIVGDVGRAPSAA